VLCCFQAGQQTSLRMTIQTTRILISRKALRRKTGETIAATGTAGERTVRQLGQQELQEQLEPPVRLLEWEQRAHQPQEQPVQERRAQLLRRNGRKFFPVLSR
jgi:hypothetical protein